MKLEALARNIHPTLDVGIAGVEPRRYTEALHVRVHGGLGSEVRFRPCLRGDAGEGGCVVDGCQPRRIGDIFLRLER